MKTFDIHEVAKAIDIPVEEWAGNCYGIACAMVDADLVEGTAVYGHWIGEIDPRSYFGARSNHSFCQHGWVLTDDGIVVDPTRWAFEDVPPYIFVGWEEDPSVTPCRHCGHIGDEHSSGFIGECAYCDCPMFEPVIWPYDEGGNALRRALRRPAPRPDGDERKYVLLVHPDALRHVQALLDDTAAAEFTNKQVFWLANLPYEQLQPYAHEIYESYKLYEEERLDAYIPFDNLQRAEREHGKDK